MLVVLCVPFFFRMGKKATCPGCQAPPMLKKSLKRHQGKCAGYLQLLRLRKESWKKKKSFPNASLSPLPVVTGSHPCEADTRVGSGEGTSSAPSLMTAESSSSPSSSSSSSSPSSSRVMPELRKLQDELTKVKQLLVAANQKIEALEKPADSGHVADPSAGKDVALAGINTLEGLIAKFDMVERRAEYVVECKVCSKFVRPVAVAYGFDNEARQRGVFTSRTAGVCFRNLKHRINHHYMVSAVHKRALEFAENNTMIYIYHIIAPLN